MPFGAPNLLALAWAALTIVVAFVMARGHFQHSRAAKRLAEIEHDYETLRLVVQNASDGLLLQEMDASIIWANPAYCKTLGWRLEEIVGLKPQEFVFPARMAWSSEDIAAFHFDPDGEEFHGLERRLNVRKNGEEFWHEFNLCVVEPMPGEQKVVLVSRDITEIVAREMELEAVRNELQHEATHDGLTDLLNRAEFMRRADQVITDTDHHLCLLQLDLNKFKLINDTRGHDAGDRVLQHIAQCMRELLGPDDIACRLGGDEFAMAILGPADLDAQARTAEALIDAIAKPIEWQKEQLRASASVGLAISGGEVSDAETLLKRADFALYTAKEPQKPPLVTYDAALKQRHDRERQLVDEFAHALDKEALEFAFHPFWDAEQDRCFGFETLARWTSRSGEAIAPQRFIEFAQRLGRKHEVDLAAMRAAIAMGAELNRQGHNLKASFNASTETLTRADFVTLLEWEADRAGLPHHCVAVEVLENTFFGQDTSDNGAARTISHLHHAGYQVFLDDFGVGYAGLSHLDKLDISGIKIDRSLVLSAFRERSSRLILQSVLRLADDLGLATLGEGVETDEQARQMVEFGCSALQGYAFARPMDAAAFKAFVTEGQKQLAMRRAG
ncbi:MAG: EAL domain-containing protein [Pseudomonadota bacterium]